MFYCHCSSTLL